MYNIQLNEKGTHFLNLTEEHLQTIEKYALFRDLIDSNGYIDDIVLEKLRFNVRGLMTSQINCSDLVNLCNEVIYHKKMKSYGLHQLILAYISWANNNANTESKAAE